MTTEPVTPERIDELLRFLPLFEKPGRAFVEKWAGGDKTPSGAITLPYPIYLRDVQEFFVLAAQPWWLDREYVPAQAAAMLQDDEVVRSASLDQIRAMLTYCVRGERFADGHWEALLQSGRIVALLHRLKALRSSP